MMAETTLPPHEAGGDIIALPRGLPQGAAGMPSHGGEQAKNATG
jgi:hypothetical protein